MPGGVGDDLGSNDIGFATGRLPNHGGPNLEWLIAQAPTTLYLASLLFINAATSTNAITTTTTIATSTTAAAATTAAHSLEINKLLGLDSEHALNKFVVFTIHTNHRHPSTLSLGTT